uniref:Heat shock 70 kDa protein 12A n=1 Tax=Oncorhynchus tshawytscha TaxID=74940 RepID=A0A8C8II28_ONCTS
MLCLLVSVSSDAMATPSPAKSMGDPGITPLSPSHIQQNDTDSNAHTGPSFIVVVAVDFGTTSSGYAYAFTKEPECIHTMRRWEGGDPGVSNQKTPTTILLTPDRKFHSFGYAARDFYHDLDPTESKHWLYLEKFKMKLHTTANLSIDTELHAANGKRVKAIDIFAYALAFFKEQALKELSDQAGAEFDNTNIRWVITVPAIWKMPAKQFMREAAYKAGLVPRDTPEQLIIALEPEAASIYCRKLRLHQMIDIGTKTTQNGFSPNENVGAGMTQAKEPVRSKRQSRTFLVENVIGELWSELEEGDRYVVVDCGGGTVDLTVHQIQLPEGHLKELYKASGGPYGSIGIDYEFEKLLCKIFGPDFIDQFKIKRPAAWVDLMIAFESRKRAAAPDRTNPLNINLPFSFIDYYKKFRGHSVEHALRKSNVDFVKWSSQGMLRMNPDAMNALFKPTIDHIIQHLKLQEERFNCCDEGFRAPKKVQKAPEPSPKVDLAAGSGHHQYRACSGMAAGRYECISRTLRRRLLEDGLVSRRAAKKPLLSRKNIGDRLIFCKRYRDWTAEDWSKVIFSDESPF